MPFTMGAEQQLQPFSWIPNNDGRHLFLLEDQHLLAHRRVFFYEAFFVILCPDLCMAWLHFFIRYEKQTT